MNIEHTYYEKSKRYKPFTGICLVDTFELAEEKQKELFTEENTQRVKKQKETDIYVVIGNPPYNVGQLNENDNNKNRKYKTVDDWVKDTYSKDSKAASKSKLDDPYVKAIKWASKRIKDTGIVALVTNNGFLDNYAFDGMRKHLAQDFNKIYHVNLKGNARTTGEQRRKESGNVFDDAIRVGIGISFFIKSKIGHDKAEIYIYSVDDYLKSNQKKEFLIKAGDYRNVPFKLAQVKVYSQILMILFQLELNKQRLIKVIQKACFLNFLV